MTDDELKALVANLAVAQDRTDAQLAKTDAQLAKTDVQQAKTDAQLAKTIAQLAKTIAQLERTDDKLNRLSDMYGGVSNNLGSVAEEFYYNSFKANPVLAGKRFRVNKNLTRCSDGLEDEFDLLLVNGQEVFVVEVKHKAHESDLERLLNKKAPNFRQLFPEYGHLEQRLALAAFHFHDALKESALEQGVTVLQRKGDVIETQVA